MSNTDTIVRIATDGACSGNPGPGGWGAVLRKGGKRRTMSGGEASTTNNRMELMAVIKALESLKYAETVEVITDSKYVQQGMTEWLPGWIKRGWRKATGEAVLNRDLWEALVKASARHTVSWSWVRGHSGHPDNEEADRLARAAIRHNP